MISVKYLVFITCLNLGIAGYNEWKAVNAQSAADDTAHAYDRSKRQASSIPSYTIELLMVIDFSLYRFWEERVRDEGNITASQIPQDAVRNKIRKFYASMGKSINFRFQNISDPYFAISVEVVDIFIADTEIASSWTETSKNISNERNIYVNGDQSLEFFNNWIKSFNNLTRHDHAMLFTRYNIEYNNLLVSGLTSGYPVCGIKSVSLVHDHFNSISATLAARLLGYSLGARSDGDGNLCSPTDNYIMSPFNAPGEGDKALNPWRFSSCSVQAFSTFLTGLNSTQDRTCLQSDDAVAINDDRTFPGSEYAVDDQCRFIRDNSSFLCRLNYEGDFSNICTNMLCYDSTSGTCAKVLPADGLSCGTGKWCENGRCVNSSRAPNNTDICLFGDADALCSSLYPSFLQYCYNESSYLICCDTCSRYKQNVSGCEFGDSKDCSQVLHISECADDITLHMCCSTCATLAASACPAGFFRSTEGNCLTCNKGTYQPYLEQSSCITCPRGTTTLTTGSNSSTQCVAVCSSGFFLNISDSCEACPRGTYQPSTGQVSCIACPTETVTLQTGSMSIIQCVVACSSGFFRTTNGSCQACPVGTYQESIEQSSCLPCPTGTSTNQTASTSRTQCVVNNCPAGTYQDFPGSPCIPCAAGSYQPQPRQSACIQCPTGKYQPNITSTECIQCSPGSYQNTTGSSSCRSCNSGAYQPDFGQKYCIQCTAGTYQPNIGTSTICNKCDPGSYQNEIGSSSCVLCEAGTYQPSPGNSSCTACPKGKYQGRRGSTMCEVCKAGNYQPEVGKATCIACPSGTYQRQNDFTSCVKCDPGFYQNNTGGSSCNPCEEGYYNSISGDESCRPCEIGTYQNSTGQSFCFPCPNKYTTQKDGERSVRACFQGYCPEYRYTIYVSAYNISVIIPSTKINQTGYSWNRCKKDSSKALVSAFCQNISRTEVAWTQEKEECTTEPEIQDFQTSPISEQLHNISKIDVNDTDHANILQKTNALIKSVDVLMPVDYGYLADILDNTNMVETVSKEVLNATLDVIDTLLRLNSSTNQSSQTSPGAPNRILKLVEDITSKTEGGTVDNPVRTIKPNIAVTVWEQVGAKLIGINLLRGNTASIQDNLVKQLDDPAAKDLYDAIFFQPDILNATKNKIVMSAIWNDALFVSGSNRYKVVSKILAAKLIQNGVSITRLDTSYITSVFHVTEDDSRIMCGYWDYTLNQNGGGWASGGCNYTRNKEKHVCTCNHLTNFAVLVDLDANTISPEHARALEIITFIGLILSIIGLSLTILTFMCFRHLRRGRGQQTLFCLCIPMVCYSIVFLVGIQRTEYYVPCIVVSVLMHYFILASFMWMLVEGILQYLRFVKVLGTYIPNFLIKTSLPAWGIPLVPVIVLLAYNYNLYYGGSGFCWMKLEALYYAFVLPVGLIILVNAIIFTIVMFNIFRRPKGMKINQSDRRLMVMNLQAGISVFVLLGLTWIFGVVALGGAKLTFQYIFVILNAFQGFFIFLMFTAREKQVRDQWIRFCRRRPTGYFTSLGRRKSSSQDTFATNVSGGMRRSSSSSFMDNRDRKLSSSCQDHRRRSNQSETNESVQDHARRNSSAQQLERDVKSVDSVVHEIDFSSLHEHKKRKRRWENI